MTEIKTPPIEGVDDDGNTVVCFTDEHSLGDIVRWLMECPADAEEVRDMLTEALERARALVH